MAKKIKIPKKIAGFKVPKQLRKSTILRQLLASEIGRDVLAAALTAGAGAAAAVLAGDRKEVAETGEAAVKRSGKMASLVVEAVESAATTAFGVIAEAIQAQAPSRRKDGKGRETQH